MKSLNFIFASCITALTIASSAGATTFESLNTGKNITINDTIWNSTYNGGSPALNTGNEDNETERLLNGTNTYTGQKWDFEGMFWNSNTNVLTLIAGWNFAAGVAHSPANVQIGDLFIGDWNSTNYYNNSTLIAQGFSPETVLDFSRDSDGSLQNSGTYTKITGNFTTNNTSDVTPLSDPYTYKSSGSSVSNNAFTYTVGSVTDTPFLGWNDSDVSGSPLNNSHYYMQIFGLQGNEIYDNVMHITLACGNDVGRGETSAPVPEPSTFLLLGAGLLGAGLIRRRARK